jgi:L-ascorbate metabolism protein UlaG (beta-lactamase superfamily)
VRQTVPPPRVTRGLRVTWVNHATALLQLDGRNLLVDPVWSDRVSPVPFAGPRRHHAPGVAFDALPPIDLVLLTHDHYDHLDLPTLRRLAARHGAPVVTGLGNAAYLAARGLPGAVELDWGDEVTLAAGGADEGAGDGAGDAPGALRATFVPARHWSARGASDRRRTLWGGFVVAGPAGRVYVAGDSGYGGHFAEAGARFGPFDLALLPIGAYRPEWFMAGHHMGPAEAVRAAAELRAAVSVPVHHGTFDLANDGQDEPVAELRRALAAAPDPPAFAVLAPGAAWASGAGVTGPDATGTEGADGWAP